MSNQTIPIKLPEDVFKAILKSKTALEVPMGGYKIMIFSSTRRYLFTQNMNSCSGLAIISRKAGLLAHIQPMDPKFTAKPGKTAGESYVEYFMGVIQQAFLAQKDLFSSDSPTVIVSAIHENILALDDQQKIITSVVAQMGLSKKVNVLYATRTTPQAKLAGGIFAGTILVTGPGTVREGSEAHVWVEGYHVTSTDPNKQRTGLLDLTKLERQPPLLWEGNLVESNIQEDNLEEIREGNPRRTNQTLSFLESDRTGRLLQFYRGLETHQDAPGH